MKRLKKHWKIQSNWQLLSILLVFSFTGSSSAYLGEPVLETIGLGRDDFADNFWGGLTYYPLYAIIIFPIYLVLLTAYGWLFGMFTFFWEFEKKMLKRMGFGFLFNLKSKKRL